MRKVRFFNSIFLEALDQRITSILDSHRTIVKQANKEFQNQQRKLDKKVNEELNLLLTSKDSATVEYKLRQLYVPEKYTSKRAMFIARKSELTTLLSIFEEMLIQLCTILVHEFGLLDQEVLKITTPHRLHSTIINRTQIYSKTINTAWLHIREAIAIEANLNKAVEKLTDEEKKRLLNVKSIKEERLNGEIRIMALTDSHYHQELTRTIEVYFIEMNDKINEAIRKKIE